VEFAFGEHVLDLDRRELSRGAELSAVEPAGLRPAGLSRTKPRWCRQQGRPIGGGVERSNRCRVDADQPHPRVTPGSRRPRRHSAVDPHRAPQRPSLRRRRRGDPERCRAAETSACAVREAVDRGAAVPEHVRPPRARIFRRRHGRGDRHRAQSYSLALRHRPQFELYLQRAGGRRETGRARPSVCDTCSKDRYGKQGNGYGFLRSRSRLPVERISADRFDGSLEDVFELQDKVALSAAGVIEQTLQVAKTARVAKRPTDDLTAYDLYWATM
jgi:hypothetical protein